MTRWRRTAGAASLVLACGILSALADAGAEAAAPSSVAVAVPIQEVGVRSGSHAGFGRIVLDMPALAAATVVPSPGAISIMVATGGSAPAAFSRLPVAPRNVAAIALSDGVLRVTLLRGVTVRQSQQPGRLVLDFVDPIAVLAPPEAHPATFVSEPATRISPGTLQGSFPGLPGTEPRGGREPPPDAAAGPIAAVPAAVQVTPLPAADPPAALPLGVPASQSAPTLVPAPPAPAPPATLTPVLPIPAGAGVAGLRRGHFGLLVVDAQAPAEIAAWHALAGMEDATVENLPGATVVSFRLPDAATPALFHRSAGWTLDLSSRVDGEADPTPGGIALSEGPQHPRFGVAGASRVISVADPLGGGTLLIGTLLDGASAPGGNEPAVRQPGLAEPAPKEPGGTMIAAARLLPSMALLPTWRGVAIEPLSDVLDMRSDPKGFVLEMGSQPSDGGATAAGGAAGAGEGRFLDLPPLPVAALVNREQAAAGAVAAAPPRARGAAQLRLAETMVALGLGAEAQAVLRLGLAEDGRLAADPEAVALGGVAALLAGRLADSGGLDDPLVRDDVTGSNEIALWRALRMAALAAASAARAPPEAARTIAARRSILLSYPAPLRDRLLPGAIQALAEGGEVRAAERVIATIEPSETLNTPSLDYARALIDIGAGRMDPALQRLDRLAKGRDRDIRARAAVRAVELRLTAGTLTRAAAADALDGLIAAWRGDVRELDLRLRVAELHAQTGQFRTALALLRETRDEGAAARWAEPRRAVVRERMASVFAQTLAQDDAHPMAPLDFVSMIEDNADLLPGGAEGEEVAARVADRLAALELPARAEAALRRLVGSAPPGAARAALGARLAAMQERQGEAEAALVTLSSSTVEGLPASLIAERTLIFARASASRGDTDAAIGALATVGGPAAETLRAELLGRAGRWPEAAASLWQQAARDIPQDGALGTDARALLLRLASAAAQAGNSDMLDRIRTDDLPRLAAGPDADALRMLTEGPVRGVADLPRAAQEAALARSLVR